RTGQQVNPHSSKQLALRLSHEGVTWTHNHIHSRKLINAKRQRRDGLDPPYAVDSLCSSEMSCGDHSRVRTSIEGRGCGGNLFSPRHTCCHDSHMCGSDQRITASRYVTTDRADRYVLMTENNSRESLHFEITNCIALVPCEGCHLV